jgi:putative acetyltransferase
LLTIRLEKPEDKATIRYVNEETFGRKEEAELIEKLRNRGMLTLSLVAIQGNKTIGHITFSPVKVESERSSFEAITLATIAIIPAYQRKGIGSQLVRAALKSAVIWDTK